MALDFESLGGGAATGFFGAIVAGLGFNKRLNKLEDGKQDKPVCESLQEGLRAEMEAMRKSIDHLSNRIDFLINSRRK